MTQNLAHSNTPADARWHAIAAQVRSLIRELSGIDVTADDATFVELGFDSLFLTQASQAIQSTFGVRMTFRQLMDRENSVRAVVNHLNATVPQDAVVPAAPAPQAPTPPPAPPSPAVAAPAPVAVPAGGSVLEQLLAQQAQLLQAVLAQSRAAARPAVAPPAPPAAPATPAPTPRAPSAGAPPAREEGKAFGPYKGIDRSVDADLSPAQRRYLADLVDRYTKRTPGSKALTQKYRQWYADPRTVAAFNRLWKEMVYQLVVVRSSGAYLWDIDGNRYIDLLNGFGPNFLGHNPPFINAALREQLEKGFEVGPQSPLAGEAAMMFCQLTGQERASFVNTGSEAVYAAIRLARTVTGRDKIVMFGKDYHGNFDEVLVRGVGPATDPRSVPIAPGIPRRAVKDMYVLDYGTDQALEFIRAHADEIAAVLVEPVQSRRPEFQPIAFVQELRRLTAERGMLLIFDEVITGFRDGPRGAQAIFGIQADLATYGKVVGAGMPIGIVAGKADYMDTFDGGFWQYGDDSFPSKGVTFFAGTFVRHPLTIAAVHAMLGFLLKQSPTFWDGLNARAARMATTIDSWCVQQGVPVRLPHFCSQMYVRVAEDQKYGNLLFYNLRHRGVFILENFPNYLTVAHTDADVDHVIQSFKESAQELRDIGLLCRR
jgi:glutamate-1-semialdehyde aminotransferase/acyl carrier protein